MRQPWGYQFKESILHSEVLGRETETRTLIRTTKQLSKSLSTIEVFFFIFLSPFMVNKIECLVNFFSERNQSEESRHSEEEEDEDEDDQVS